ncbi:MAG: cytochrome c biogenesis protein [Syntrophales bacterium]|nr:cytochrome c biogenesis protein [Syntrophales bacterium]
MNTIVFFYLAVVVYLMATVLYTVSLVRRRVHPAKHASWTMATAFLFHSLLMFFMWQGRGFTLFATAYDVFLFFAWSLTGFYLLFQLRTKTRVLGISIAPVSLILLLLSSPGVGEPVSIPKILESGLVHVHVLFAIMGEALFLLATLAGIAYLIQDRVLKGKRQRGLFRYLPPLKDLDRINEWALIWGLVFLTVGIIAGMFYARVTWTGSWHLDAKIIWSWVAWVAFAVLVHQRLAIGWTGRRPAIFTCGFFIFLAITFILENFLFTSQHRFF